jgi:surface protein
MSKKYLILVLVLLLSFATIAHAQLYINDVLWSEGDGPITAAEFNLSCRSTTSEIGIFNSDGTIPFEWKFEGPNSTFNLPNGTYDITCAFPANSQYGWSIGVQIINTCTDNCPCYEEWKKVLGECTNDVKLKTYEDIHSCGTYEKVPADNGTLLDCTPPMTLSINGLKWWNISFPYFASDFKLTCTAPAEWAAVYSSDKQQFIGYAYSDGAPLNLSTGVYDLVCGYPPNSEYRWYEDISLESAPVIPPCTPDWVQANTECDGATYIVQYTDSNNCATADNLPPDNGTIVDCTPQNPENYNGAIAYPFSDSSVVYEEDFEDNNADNWVLNSATDLSGNLNGAHSLSINGYESPYTQYVNIPEMTGKVFAVTATVKSASDDSGISFGIGSELVGSRWVTSSQYDLYCYMNAPDFYCTDNGLSVLITTDLLPDEKYTIKFVVDDINKIYDLYINGVHYGTLETKQAPVTYSQPIKYNRLNLFYSDANGRAQIDDIVVEEQTGMVPATYDYSYLDYAPESVIDVPMSGPDSYYSCFYNCGPFTRNTVNFTKPTGAMRDSTISFDNGATFSVIPEDCWNNGYDNKTVQFWFTGMAGGCLAAPKANRCSGSGWWSGCNLDWLVIPNSANNKYVMNWKSNTCMENWVKRNNGCSDGSYVVEYYDANNCGTTNDFPTEFTADDGETVTCPAENYDGVIAYPFSDSTVIYNENFEDNVADNWVANPGTDMSGRINGSYALSMNEYQYPYRSYVDIPEVTGQVFAITATFKNKPYSNGLAFGIGSEDVGTRWVSSSQYTLYCYMNAPNLYCTDNGNMVSVSTGINVSESYRVKFVVDDINKIYDLYVNGIHQGTFETKQAPVTYSVPIKYNRLYLFNYGDQNSRGMVDDIVVEKQAPVQPAIYSESRLDYTPDSITSIFTGGPDSYYSCYSNCHNGFTLYTANFTKPIGAARDSKVSFDNGTTFSTIPKDCWYGGYDNNTLQLWYNGWASGCFAAPKANRCSGSGWWSGCNLDWLIIPGIVNNKYVVNWVSNECIDDGTGNSCEPIAGFCYQGLPTNSAHNCGQNSGTYSAISDGGYVAMYYYNYTIPQYATKDSKVQIRRAYEGITNYSIPASCLSGSTLQLRYLSGLVGSYSAGCRDPWNQNQPCGFGQCFDGNNWVEFITPIMIYSGAWPGDGVGVADANLSFDENYDTYTFLLPGYNQWATNLSDGYRTTAMKFYELGMWWYKDTTICTENWVQQNSTCDGHSYTISYTDSNNCGTTNSLPLDNGTIVSCENPFSDFETIYFEDFEDGIADNWTLHQDMSVNSIAPLMGTYSLNGNVFGHYTPNSYLPMEFNTNNNYTVSALISANSNGMGFAVYELAGDGNVINTPIYCGISVLGGLRCVNANSEVMVPGVTITSNTAYNLKYVIKVADSKYDIYLDDVKVASDYNMRAHTELNAILFAYWNSGSTGKMDNIMVQREGPEVIVPQVTCSVCNETCSPCGGGCTATNLDVMFRGVQNFDTTVGDITGWDTSCITSMANAFDYSDFNQDIGNWNTSSVTSMNAMFSFNQFNQDISRWDTSKVTDMNGMFYRNYAFNQPIGSWNVSNVHDMSSMFYNAHAFNQPLNNWDTHNVAHMYWMFMSAYNFNQDISNWTFTNIDTWHSQDMTGMIVETSFSTENYDKLLISLSQQAVPSYVHLDAYAKYSATAKPARDILTGTYGWTIADNGLLCEENWVQQNADCDLATHTMFVQYADSNSCGTIANLPADNGTTVSCVPVDTDADGLPDQIDPNATNPDTDGDGLCDGPVVVEGACTGSEDANGNGVVDSGETNPNSADSDSDGTADAVDCAPLDSAISPNAAELCDGIDNNCNGIVDENLIKPAENIIGLCSANTQTCSAGTWANTVTNYIPSEEVCNNLDDNCDGTVDENVKLTFYRDADNDAYGDVNLEAQGCSAPLGYVADFNDCNDNNSQINPSATESCDGIDNDCSALTVDGLSESWYNLATTCGVGVCEGNAGVMTCQGGVQINTCNAFTGAIVESCDDATGYDAIDNNCDGNIDLNCESYCDVDGDGYTTHAVCLFAGKSLGDCDDSAANIHPGAEEVCDNVDNNCNAQVDDGLTFDLDGDGYSSIGSCQGTKNDCDDAQFAINPYATEVCNAFDDNCNGLVNEGFADEDNDGIADCIDLDDDADGVPDANDACPLVDATGFDADHNGCIDSINGLQQMINTLPSDVLSDTIRNSLASKVDNALKSLNKDNDDAAINMLEAFKNQVNAQRGKKISVEAADMLTAYANNVIAQIRLG